MVFTVNALCTVERSAAPIMLNYAINSLLQVCFI